MEHAYKKETQINVTKAQASVPEDFTRIINSFNGVPVEQLECEPDLSYENCKEVSKIHLQMAMLIATAGGSRTTQHVCTGFVLASSRQRC